MFRYLVFGQIFILYSDGVDYFLGTADDELWPLIQGKLDVLNKVGLSKDNFKVCVVLGDKDLLRMIKKTFKNAQVWKFSSYGFFLFFHHKASMGRRL